MGSQPVRTPNAGSVFSNVLWLYADQGLRAVIALMAFSAVTRYLGPEQFGVLSYAVAFPAMFLPLASLGLEFVVVQELVRRPTERMAILATAARLIGVASLLSLGSAAAATTFLPVDHAARPMIWVTMIALLGQPFQVIDFFFQSRVAARYAVVARLGSALAVNAFRFWLVWHGATVNWFAWAAVIEAGATALGLMLAFRMAGETSLAWWRGATRAEARRLLLAAWPLMAGGVAMVFFLRFDQLLLSLWAGDAALGKYAAAMRLADAAQFVTYAFVSSWFPQLVAAHRAGAGDFKAATERLFRRITHLSLAVALGVSLAAPWIVGGLLGQRFEGTGGVLVVLAWANVFAAQITVRGKWFLLEGWQVSSLGFFVLGAVVHLSLLAWLAPAHGALGAAIAFTVAQAAMSLAAPVLAGKTRLAASLAWRSFLPAKSTS
ncbi:MAG: flippase [Verrucomicrobiota bacterium]